ncbi:hypothetical protein JCM15765_14070 [Paradesulfitobacterium aromaticivorans]
MAQLTTGLLENTAVSGVRPSTNLIVRITNDDTATNTVFVKGYYVSGTAKTQYVQEFITMAAGEVVSRNYYAQFDAFEFQFTTSSDTVEISAWGKDAAGNLTPAQRAVVAELNLFS